MDGSISSVGKSRQTENLDRIEQYYLSTCIFIQLRIDRGNLESIDHTFFPPKGKQKKQLVEPSCPRSKKS